MDHNNDLTPCSLRLPDGEKGVGEVILFDRTDRDPSDNIDIHCSYMVKVAGVFELLAAIEERHRPLILVHAQQVSEDNLDILTTIKQMPNHPRMALLFDQETEMRAFSAARRLKINYMLPDCGWLHAPDWERWLHWVLTPPGNLGLKDLLKPGYFTKSFTVTNNANKRMPTEAISEWAENNDIPQSDIYDFRLAMEELINNAIYHGFRNWMNQDKYRMNTFKELAASEEVLAEIAADDEMFGICVKDNGGNLSHDKTLERILNQLSLSGLMDENGRGLFLIYTLSSRMFVKLDPGESTEVIALFFRDPKPAQVEPAARPIIIFTPGGAQS